MKRIFISTIVMMFLLMDFPSTVMAMGRHGDESGVSVVVTAPALPSVVVMEQEPYYHHQGYYYYYNRDQWYYSKSKRGPWTKLPRDRYAKEVKYKGKHWKYDQGRHQYHEDRGHHDDRRQDNRGYDQRKDDRGHDKRKDDRGGYDQRDDDRDHDQRRY